MEQITPSTAESTMNQINTTFDSENNSHVPFPHAVSFTTSTPGTANTPNSYLLFEER